MKIVLKVIPNAKETKVLEDEIDLLGTRVLKIKVSSPPQDGRANDATIKLLSSYLSTPKSKIKITSGTKSQHKIIEIKED